MKTGECGFESHCGPVTHSFRNTLLSSWLVLLGSWETARHCLWGPVVTITPSPHLVLQLLLAAATLPLSFCTSSDYSTVSPSPRMK